MLWTILRSLLGLYAVAVAATAAPASEAPTAADLVAPPVFFEPLLSPDGRHVIARGMIDGAPAPLLIDLMDAERRMRPIPVAGGQHIAWHHWTGDRAILGVRARASAKTGGETLRLAALDPASGRLDYIGGELRGLHDGRIVHFDREGRFLLLSASARPGGLPAVHRIDLRTGVAAEIVKPQRDVREWQADSEGVVRAGLGERHGRSVLLYRRREGDPFRRSSQARVDQVEQRVPVAGSDGGYAIASDASGRAALFRYDFATGAVGALVYAHPEADVEGFETDPDGKVAGVRYTADRAGVAWLDSEFEALQQRIDAALPDRVNRIESASADERRLLLSSSSAADPGSYYLFDRDSGKTELLAQPHAALAGKRLADMRTVRYRARDGLEIRGYLTLPPGREEKGLALVVMPHGGPFARDSWGYDSWVQHLAAKGYAVLQPNFRGSTGFGREFVEAGDGEWGRGMQDDIDDGVRWLAAQGTIDAGRVCIMGASFGGYAAMWAAARNPESYRCAISFAGISDIDAQLAFDRETFESAGAWRAWRARIRGRDGASLAKLSPIRFADRITMPLLIAHGTADKIVPVDQSRRLHQALAKRNQSHDYIEYTGEGHDFEDPASAEDFLNRAGAFLDRHNPS